MTNVINDSQVHTPQYPHTGKSVEFTSANSEPVDAATGKPLDLRGDTVELSPEVQAVMDRRHSVAVSRTERNALLESSSDGGFSVFS